MDIQQALTLYLYFLGAHWLCDYPLQGQFLSDAKSNGPLRIYHLIAHAGIHGAAVALITGNVWLGFVELILHTIIDELKVRKITSFSIDQSLHILCKALYVIILILY